MRPAKAHPHETRRRTPRTAARAAATARNGGTAAANEERGLTARGLETRRRIVSAARTVFEESGFVEARISDIAKLAGSANGSFYTYFDSKEDILEAVAMDVFDELEAAYHLSETTDPRTAIENVNRQYFDTWMRNRKMLMTLYQVSGFLGEIFARLTQSHDLHAERIAKRLRQLQREGLVDNDLDANHAAVALGAMVEQSLRWWIGQGHPFDPEVALTTLNKMSIRAIGLGDRRGIQNNFVTSQGTEHGQH
jgi:AcrR family transcriptional regulator